MMDLSINKQIGFNLIELLIVVAIISLLLFVALPNYQAYVMKSRRLDATATLLSIQMAQEKYRSNQATYGDLNQIWGGVTTAANGYYTLSTANLSASTYQIIATAQNGQSADQEKGTACNVLSLTVNGLNTQKTPAACWPN